MSYGNTETLPVVTGAVFY